MTNSPELRCRTADALEAAASRVPQFTAFVGLDGFVDEILHVVDKRYDAERFDRVPTIKAYAERIAAASGKSTNVELVKALTKLGGNGPIMANALATFGLKVTYLGALGWPTPHSVFSEFCRHAEVHSICDPGFTDALEFDDGKLMVGKHYSLKDVTWANIQSRFGAGPFGDRFGNASLVAFVNWTMLPYMSDIWESILAELCPKLAGPRRRMFVDLADPEKRLSADIGRALELVVRFQRHFDVILGLNEKEAHEVAAVLGLRAELEEAEGFAGLALEIQKRVPVDTLVVHPVSFALAVTDGRAEVIQGPYVAKPKITTGAGDHFNSGFCLGKLLGFDNAASILCGVTTSGHYVRTAQSPDVSDLVTFLRTWPAT